MIPLVVVQAPSAPPAGYRAEVLLDACTSALPIGRCVGEDEVQSGRGGPSQVAAVAVFAVGADGRLRVEVALAGEDDWSVEVLTFSPSDPELERWRAAGFAIAALAGASPLFTTEPESGDASSEPVESAVQPKTEPADAADEEVRPEQAEGSAEPSSVPESEPTDGVAVPRLRALVGATLGRAFDDGTLRGGVRAEAAAVPFDFPATFGLGVGWAAAPENAARLSQEAFTVSVGVGLVQIVRAVDVRTLQRLNVDFDRVLVTARGGAGGSRRDSGARWMTGFSVGGCIEYPAKTRISASGCFDAAFFVGSTGIVVDGERVGSVPSVNFRAAVGPALVF